MEPSVPPPAVSGRPPHDVVEIRVHGIGDHDQWSSLGSPVVIESDERSGLAVVEPRRRPEHRVLLFNWSRVTRRVLRPLWYLAFPYTLLNVAEQMRPVGSRWGTVAHQALVRFAAVCLTVLTAVWVMSAGETAALMLNRERLLGVSAPRLLLWASACALIAVALGRARKSSGAHRRSAALHAAVVAAVASAADVLEPARARLSDDSYFIAHATLAPDAAGLQQLRDYFDEAGPAPDEVLRIEQFPYLDALGLVSYACLFAVLACAGFVALAALGTRRTVSGPLVGTAAAVALSALLAVLTLTALFRSLPSVLAPLLRWLGHGADPVAPGTNLFPLFGRSQPNVALPLVALLLLLLFAALLAACAWMRPAFVLAPLQEAVRARSRARSEGGPGELRAREVLLRRMRWSHDLVTNRLPTVLSAALVCLFFAAEGLTYVLIQYFMGRVERQESQWFTVWVGGAMVTEPPLATLGDRAVSIGVTASVALGSWIVVRGASGPLRSVFASMGDVAGFWPITVSPFGGRDYRGAVVSSLRSLIQRHGPEHVVLVGHSQGSVIAAWYSHENAPPVSAEDGPGRLRGLVTCGSPLLSLYGRFFPSSFDAEFYDAVGRGSRSWENFWRDTDPIATPLSPPCHSHAVPDDPVEAGDGRPRGHSDYWIEPAQTAAVERLVAGVASEEDARGASVGR